MVLLKDCDFHTHGIVQAELWKMGVLADMPLLIKWIKRAKRAEQVDAEAGDKETPTLRLYLL